MKRLVIFIMLVSFLHPMLRPAYGSSGAASAGEVCTIAVAPCKHGDKCPLMAKPLKECHAGKAKANGSEKDHCKASYRCSHKDASKNITIEREEPFLIASFTLPLDSGLISFIEDHRDSYKGLFSFLLDKPPSSNLL